MPLVRAEAPGRPLPGVEEGRVGARALRVVRALAERRDRRRQGGRHRRRGSEGPRHPDDSRRAPCRHRRGVEARRLGGAFGRAREVAGARARARRHGGPAGRREGSRREAGRRPPRRALESARPGEGERGRRARDARDRRRVPLRHEDRALRTRGSDRRGRHRDGLSGVRRDDEPLRRGQVPRQGPVRVDAAALPARDRGAGQPPPPEPDAGVRSRGARGAPLLRDGTPLPAVHADAGRGDGPQRHALALRDAAPARGPRAPRQGHPPAGLRGHPDRQRRERRHPPRPEARQRARRFAHAARLRDRLRHLPRAREEEQPLDDGHPADGRGGGHRRHAAFPRPRAGAGHRPRAHRRLGPRGDPPLLSHGRGRRSPPRRRSRAPSCAGGSTR